MKFVSIFGIYSYVRFFLRLMAVGVALVGHSRRTNTYVRRHRWYMQTNCSLKHVCTYDVCTYVRRGAGSLVGVRGFGSIISIDKYFQCSYATANLNAAWVVDSNEYGWQHLVNDVDDEIEE
jgi:hypothetical protein